MSFCDAGATSSRDPLATSLPQSAAAICKSTSGPGARTDIGLIDFSTGCFGDRRRICRAVRRRHWAQGCNIYAMRFPDWCTRVILPSIDIAWMGTCVANKVRGCTVAGDNTGLGAELRRHIAERHTFRHRQIRDCVAAYQLPDVPAIHA